MSATMLPERPPFVRFELRYLEDRAKTIETGAYTESSVPFALITPPGSRDCVEMVAEEWLAEISAQSMAGRYNPEWVSMFRSKYAQWKQGYEPVESGHPLVNWPPMPRGMLKKCLDHNVRTVEDLAALTEPAIQSIGMGARVLKAQAQAWLETAKASIPAMEVHSLTTSLEELKAKVAELTKDNQALAAQNEALKKAFEHNKKV